MNELNYELSQSSTANNAEVPIIVQVSCFDVPLWLGFERILSFYGRIDMRCVCELSAISCNKMLGFH